MFTKFISGLSILLVTTLLQASDSGTASIIDLSKLMRMDQLVEKIGTSQVVYVSEIHTRYDHHLNQLAIIKSQHERHEKLAIGLEFIQQPFQSVLDDYIAGRITEEAMLKGTQYFERWSYDFRLYRPIFQFALEHGIPLIALNIDRDIIDKIKSEGMEKLSDEHRQYIPVDIDRDDAAYRERLQEVYDQHPQSEEHTFDRFLEIQLLWDESMAARAAEWFQQQPDGHMVILAGGGHIMYGTGIPNRLQRRQALTSSSVINISSDTPINPDMGDYIILTDEQNLPPAGKLGVILDSSKSPPAVMGFTQESGADEAGLEKNDQIVRIGDKKISSYADVRIAILDKGIDQKIEVEVIREGLIFGPQNHNFEITLK